MYTSSNRILFLGYPDFVRFSWGPAKDAVKDNGVLVEWEADEEEDDDHQQTQIKSFFMDEKNARKRKRTKYFEKHGLSVVEAIAK